MARMKSPDGEEMGREMGCASHAQRAASFVGSIDLSHGPTEIPVPSNSFTTVVPTVLGEA